MDNERAPAWSALSEREREVVRLSAEGFTDAGVGEKLGLAAETVRSHWKRVRRRLGGVSRAEVVRLLAQEEKNPYRDLFELLLAPVFYKNRSLVYLDVNAAGLAMLGYSKSEMVGHSFSEFLAPEGQHLPRHIDAEFEITDSWQGACPMLRKDGTVVTLKWRSRRDPKSGRVVSIGDPS